MVNEHPEFRPHLDVLLQTNGTKYYMIEECVRNVGGHFQGHERKRLLQLLKAYAEAPYTVELKRDEDEQAFKLMQGGTV